MEMEMANFPTLSALAFYQTEMSLLATSNSRVSIFDSQGNFVGHVGVDQLKNPYHLFVDSDDNILVADYSNNRIQVFKSDGSLVKTFGVGQVSNPTGVCIDLDGRILVSELSNRISIF